MSDFNGRRGGRRPRNRRRYGGGSNWSVSPNADDELPPELFTTLSIFPTDQDLDPEQDTFLRANKEREAFRDTEHYLDVQFRLLREDYIRPLRNGIQEYRELKDSGQPVRRIQDLKLYHDVKIIGMTCKGGLDHFVQFALTGDLQRVRWQSSKRLIFGSLVCLSRDDFQTVYFAVVSDRQIKLLHKGIIQLHFENCLMEVLSLSSNTTFTMAESSAFFEAYRHVLEGMQEMQTTQSLPFSRYLVCCNAAINPPRYLANSFGQNQLSAFYQRSSATSSAGRMDLSCLLREGSFFSADSVRVLQPGSWPPLHETTLNQSQLDAIQLTLTNELTIIQGPPGTGKTYVGLKVTKILLQNRTVWTDPTEGRRPILVVCYTNHALDQFLAGIQTFCPDGIVRVGSRCKDPEIEKFNLKNVRKKAKKRATRAEKAIFNQCFRECKELQREVIRASSKLAATTKGVVSASAVRAYLFPGQFESLTKGRNPTSLFSRSAFSSQAALRDAMSNWLTNGRVEEEESDAELYASVAAEVTKKILEGDVTASAYLDIDCSQIHSLPYSRRAHLYRSWVQGTTRTQRQQHAGLTYTSAATTSQTEIPADNRLHGTIPGYLHTAIVFPVTSQHHRETAYLVQAWLGVSDTTPPQEVTRMISQGELLHESRVSTDEVTTMALKRRAALYRFWVTTLRSQLDETRRRQHQPYETCAATFKLMETSVVPDNLLQALPSPDFLRLFGAIRTEMLRRHERQSQFFVKSWLGVQEFCQNLQSLESVLTELEKAKDEENDDDAPRRLNVDEEAEILQNARVLDDDDDEEEDDDDEEIDHVGRHAVAKSSTLDLETAMQEMGISLAFDTSTPASTPSLGRTNAQGWTQVPRTQLVRKLKRLLTSSRPMTSLEAGRVRGPEMWEESLSMEDRVRLYLYWLEQLQGQLRSTVQPLAETYERASKRLKELRMLEDRKILVEASVIGMTTTGAAKHRKVLAEVACPIIILEEAAEVLEAHVVTTLHTAVQHLILIGDHQQLKPSTTVYELRDFKLDLSLFERLVNNRLPHVTLAVQHRMRPEVARLVRHVYPVLLDHVTTENRPHVKGVAQDVFLFHHEAEELRNNETCSRSNKHEAELCVRLCRYLLQQDYSPEQITILTAYSGQVFALTNALKQEEQRVQEVRVTSVDNYQGEENDIIILSLVRNNRDGIVGFLSTDNRVCVALSRARNGFYVFGNFQILADSSQLWKNVCQTAKEHDQLGTKLTLRCENHDDRKVQILTAEDFDKAPEGGCMLPCGKTLDKCGHVCRLRCHGYDRDHVQYQCQEKCQRASACKQPKEQRHPCTRRCFQDCGKDCMTRIEKTVPMCGHKVQMECHRNPTSWICKERCAKTLSCGHQCAKECGDCCRQVTHSDLCVQMVEKPLVCGHKIRLPCNVSASTGLCQKPCDASLGCGHACKGVCGVCRSDGKHTPCLEKVEKLLPCGHWVPSRCGASASQVPACQKPCEGKLPSCGHRCTGICGACRSSGAHQSCPETVEKYGPCGHVVVAACGAASLPSCGKPCDAKLACGHPCAGVCGACLTDAAHKTCLERVVKSRPCGHVISDQCGATVSPACGQPCPALLKCGHACKGTCGVCQAGGHKKCAELVTRKFKDCGHPVKLECSATTAPPCQQPCAAALKCGHACTGVCGQCRESGTHAQCQEQVRKFQSCGHTVTAECGATAAPVCNNPCKGIGKCGHACRGVCGVCQASGHSPCEVKVERKYADCRHPVTLQCSATTAPACPNPCGAKLGCGHACQGVCSVCKAAKGHVKCKEDVEKVYKSCRHPVTLECSAIKVPPCKHPCGLKLGCGHTCTGVCGSCKAKGEHNKCHEMVKKRLYCKHTVTAECGTAKMAPCIEPCGVTLKCGHACKGVCGECTNVRAHKSCQEVVEKVYADCGHPVSAECSAKTASPCKLPCGTKLTCGHACKGVCGECKKRVSHDATKCKERVRKIQSCGHDIAADCGATALPACSKPCRDMLKCGHACKGTCGDCTTVGHKKCQEKVEKRIDRCSHSITADCAATSAPPCTSPCGTKLKCGHKCTGTCSVCKAHGRHSQCRAVVDEKCAVECWEI